MIKTLKKTAAGLLLAACLNNAAAEKVSLNGTDYEINGEGDRNTYLVNFETTPLGKSCNCDPKALVFQGYFECNNDTLKKVAINEEEYIFSDTIYGLRNAVADVGLGYFSYLEKKLGDTFYQAYIGKDRQTAIKTNNPFVQRVLFDLETRCKQKK